MPVVLRIRNLRFYFYSNEHEPKHIHVTDGRRRPGLEVKIELESLKISKVKGFSKRDVNQIVKIVAAYQQHLLDEWEGYFDDNQE